MQQCTLYIILMNIVINTKHFDVIILEISSWRYLNWYGTHLSVIILQTGADFINNNQ